ncbi:hypothetical protein C8R44DRAFT_819495 [Mycena epipterygia]|nr:hypothetical protein C8R44DRAFT_819495 [Mycena epipterygia]
MQYYESDAYVSLKACDSCGNIHRKRDLVRCSFCKWQNYCSKQCQTVDWKSGHRQACHRINMVSRDEPENLSARDRSFLRALLDIDYKRIRIDILQRELEFMDEFPTEILCIVFDYTPGQMQLHLIPASQLGSELEDDVARAERSNGRIQLHLASISNGRSKCNRLFPMHSSSTALADGLKSLKAQLDEGVGGSAPIYAQIRDRISALVGAIEQRVVQSH